MKKRILSILLLCCMVLTLLPTTVLAADGPMDTVPKYDVSIDVYNRTSDISIKDSRSYYIYSSVPDKLRDTWAWDKKIFIQGDKAAPHVFIDGVNIKMSPSSKGPAIELNKKASAYLYFIGKDSTLQGADGRAAIQKNRSEGQLYVLARTGTTVTCKGGYRAAGIGGSWAIRNIGDSMFNMDMYGHGVNMYFGSQSNPDYWGGTINATGGEYGAGIGAGSWGHSGHSGNTIHGGAGERLYFYSGTVNASGGRLAAGIGGGFRGRGSHIYIYGGNIDAQGGDTGAGIGGGSWTTKQDMDGINAASDIVISGGRVSARGQYNCAGIGGGQYVPARNITITGGHVSATGHYGAAIGGGRWCHGKNITITDATLNLSTNYRSNGSDAAAVGYGDIVYKPEQLVADPSIATNDRIKVGSYKGKLVQLKLEARALSRDDEYSYFWNLYETLIPDENGLIDMQLLTLPYVQNYGWAINVLEMTVIDDPCNGNHDFGWVNRQSCHIWACRNKDCQARDPAAEMSKQNGKHVPGDWGIQEKHCAVCDHLLEKDTAAPVLEVLTDGERYTVEDSFVGNPGAYTFTVSDPAKSGEASSGVKSVTINGVEQKADSTYYSLPAPDGGNNDAGAEYTVVATDNAGNASTATVKIYRRHRVRVVSPDEQTTYAEAELAHNEYLVLTMKMPDGAAVRMTDKADHSEIPYDKEMGRFTVGLIDRSRTLVLEYNTEYPKAELILGRSQYFFGYNADTAEPHYLADVSRKTDKNVYSVAVQINADVIPSHYFSSPVCYTQEELAELDKQGKIAWEKYQHPEPEPGVWIVYIPTATIDIAEYDANGSWYVYAKAENLKGTTYVSTPKLIADVEKPKAINLSTGKELETDGEYWGDLRFRVEDALPVKVWHERYPGGNIELMTPDEDGCYTIPADYDVSLHHDIFLEDACGNKTYYNDIDILWNYLEVVREKDYWDVQPAQPIRISREQDLQEELSKVNIGVFASDVTGFIPVDVSWEIPEDYDPQSPREQTFTVLGTVILEGTGARCVSGLDVITRPGEEWKKNFSISVTVEGAPQYRVTAASSENGTVTVVNATETAEDGTPLFCKDDLVMLSIAPNEGYMLSTLSINGTPASFAVEDDTYTFAQPEENVTITATFEKRNEHTITFDANGGSEPEDLPEEVTTAMPAKKVLHGSEYCLPECEFIAPEGKQFKAWQIGDSEYAVNDPVTVTADITVKALWEDAPPAPTEYTVTVTNDGNGTASASPAKAVVGTEITLTATPNTGYRFKEWQVISGGVSIENNKFLMPDSDVEVKAIFEEDAPPAPDEYTVRFNANGGGGTMADVTGVSGSYTLPACGFTEPEGKQFKGWSTSADGSVISGTTYEVSSDTTFYAIWENKEYSVIVTDGKATIGAGSEISKAVQGTTITLTANAAPDGKVFDKWVVESGSTTLEDANSETTTFIMPNSEVSVKATYKNAPVATYSLTTQVNGGHGTISASKTGLTEGSAETVIFTPDDGYEIDIVTVNGAAAEVLSNILNVTMDADKTVIVKYKAIPHTHTYDQEIQKPEALKSAADCTNDEVYFKSCSCGDISTTETFTAAGTQLGHAWASDWSKDTDNHWKECSRCHEKKDEAAHNYGSDNICDACGYDKTVPHTHNLTLVPAKAPTCTEKGNTAYYTCDGCDKWFEDATGASEITDKTSVILAATGHSASDWKSDNTDHWKECTVVGCGVIIEGSKVAHTAGEWIIDTPATATTSGSKHKECTVCGYTITTEAIPATGGEHTHSYGSEWKNDADNHWHECSCGDKKDTSAHTAGEWIIDTPATAATDGSKHKECTVCGYTMAIEAIPATGGEHIHSYGSEWKNDADNHWHECSCGDKKDTSAHTAGEWIIDTPATATTSGSKHKECTVCGYTMTTEAIPATGIPTEPGKPIVPNSPQTGDNSNIILWIALLFISGGTVIGITVYSKKKKENAE